MIFIVLWILVAFVGGGLGIERGHPWLGLLLGAVLGIFGWLLILVVPRTAEAREAHRAKRAHEEALRTRDAARTWELQRRTPKG